MALVFQIIEEVSYVGNTLSRLSRPLPKYLSIQMIFLMVLKNFRRAAFNGLYINGFRWNKSPYPIKGLISRI